MSEAAIIQSQLRDGLHVDDITRPSLIEIEGGNWAQEGKYQVKQMVVKSEDSGKHYAIQLSRTGSPFTDWDYEPAHVYEVAPVERVITSVDWVLV